MEDQNFKEKGPFYDKISKAGREYGQNKLRMLFGEADKELDKNDKTRRLNKYKWAIAASIILCIGVGFWWTTQASVTNNLYAQHFEKFPNLEYPIEKNVPSVDTLAMAFQFYEKEDYKKAILLFESLLKKESNTPFSTTHFYKGLSHLAVNEFVEAENLLREISEDKVATYQHAAQWYLALTYLKKGDEINCLTTLKIIQSNSNHRYFKKAEKLREAL